eukprot:jgi/Chrzof1/310/Cz01g10230.t1
MAVVNDTEAELSYYAVLNVSREATADEIKKAYRSLAQVFHPDKHTTDDLRDKAQEAFSRLQEAYEVLSDPHKREVYDIYGKEGLTAGLEIGTKLKSIEELRQEWLEFKAKTERQRQEAMTNHRGYYLCKIDATKLVRGDVSQLPPFRVIVVQNSVDIPATESDIFHVQGQAALKGNIGTGSILCGYKRILSQHDAIDASALLGLRSLLTLTTTRQINTYTAASLIATYNAEQGVGLQLSTTRQLLDSTQGVFTWVIGPSLASGMSLSIVYRASKFVITGRVEVGVITSVSLKGTYLLSEITNLRMNARLGTSGIDAEVGIARKFSPISSGYMGTQVGLMGVQMKVRCSRAGQVFDFPIILSTDYREWGLIVGATLLPPLTAIVVTRFVFRPLARWRQKANDRRQQEERADEIRINLKKAVSEAALLEPVAKRRAAAEAAEDGLIILEAVYGVVADYKEHRQQQAASSRQQQQPQQQQQQHIVAGRSSQPSSTDVPEPEVSQQNGTSSTRHDHAASISSNGAQPADSSQPSSSSNNGFLHPWLDVTQALQYLVNGSKLELYSGVSKKGLMGFADPAPSCEKRLYVAFSYQRQLFEKEVGDAEMLRLPGAGEAIKDPDHVQHLQQKLQQLKQS